MTSVRLIYRSSRSCFTTLRIVKLSFEISIRARDARTTDHRLQDQRQNHKEVFPADPCCLVRTQEEIKASRLANTASQAIIGKRPDHVAIRNGCQSCQWLGPDRTHYSLTVQISQRGFGGPPTQVEAPVPLYSSRSFCFVTRFVTCELTSFGSGGRTPFIVSFTHTVYGYLRGPDGLARALPM